MYPRIPIRENLLCGKRENWDQNTPSNSPRARGTKEKFWKERVHREESFISVNLMSAVRAHPSLRRGHKRKLRNKRDAPAEQHGTWRKHIHKLQKKDKATFCSPVEIEAMPAPMPKSREERIFVVFSCCRSKRQNECRLGKGKFCDKVHRHRSIRAAAPRGSRLHSARSRSHISASSPRQIPSVDVTTHSPMLLCTVRHAAWILTRHKVRRDTK